MNPDDLFARIGRVEPPDGFTGRVMRKVAMIPQERPAGIGERIAGWLGSPLLWTPVAAAAALALAVNLGSGPAGDVAGPVAAIPAADDTAAEPAADYALAQLEAVYGYDTEELFGSIPEETGRYMEQELESVYNHSLGGNGNA